MKRLLFFVFILSGITSNSFSQTIDTAYIPIWTEMMDNPNAKLAEVQEAFEMYFEGRERQPGDGWKVFKRWENQWKDQLNEDGTLKDMAAEAEKYEQWLIQYPYLLNHLQIFQRTRSLLKDQLCFEQILLELIIVVLANEF